MKEQFNAFIEDLRVRSHPLKEEMVYALYPAGKLFRPKLFYAVCDSLNFTADNSLQSFALFLEVHHAYTLVHDDLPCMDDSETRRGKDSVHKKFGEWRAVLTGDALLALSFELLLSSKSFQQVELEKLAHWCVGAKGLIAGQVFDLDAKNPNYEEVKRIHDLKTGRLILLSTLAPYYFQEKKDPMLFRKLWKLGVLVGRVFQLKDDYDDFVSKPDDSLNIFKIDEARAMKDLKKSENQLNSLLGEFPKVQELLKLLK